MTTIRNFVLVLFFCGFQVANVFSMTESTSVDSICNLMQGKWYKVLDCNGYTGSCNSVVSDEITLIERIAGTDSITWIQYKNDTLYYSLDFQVSYSWSYLLKQNRWILSISYLRKIIEFADNQFSCIVDAWDGGSCTYSRTMVATGIINQTTENSQLSVFPNPTSSLLFIKGVEDIERVDIIDSDGKVLQCKGNIDAVGAIDISGLSNGVYFVRVVSIHKSYIEKIIKI